MWFLQITLLALYILWPEQILTQCASQPRYGASQLIGIEIFLVATVLPQLQASVFCNWGCISPMPRATTDVSGPGLEPAYMQAPGHPTIRKLASHGAQVLLCVCVCFLRPRVGLSASKVGVGKRGRGQRGSLTLHEVT